MQRTRVGDGLEVQLIPLVRVDALFLFYYTKYKLHIYNQYIEEKRRDKEYHARASRAQRRGPSWCRPG